MSTLWERMSDEQKTRLSTRVFKLFDEILSDKYGCKIHLVPNLDNAEGKEGGAT